MPLLYVYLTNRSSASDIYITDDSSTQHIQFTNNPQYKHVWITDNPNALRVYVEGPVPDFPQPIYGSTYSPGRRAGLGRGRLDSRVGAAALSPHVG
jgi:predicted secreted protein